MAEGPITLSIHGVTLASTLLILGVLFRQHRVWVRLKDRVDSLWREYAHNHKIDFKPLENGKSGD